MAVIDVLVLNLWNHVLGYIMLDMFVRLKVTFNIQWQG